MYVSAKVGLRATVTADARRAARVNGCDDGAGPGNGRGGASRFRARVRASEFAGWVLRAVGVLVVLVVRVQVLVECCLLRMKVGVTLG